MPSADAALCQLAGISSHIWLARERRRREGAKLSRTEFFFGSAPRIRTRPRHGGCQPTLVSANAARGIARGDSMNVQHHSTSNEVDLDSTAELPVLELAELPEHEAAEERLTSTDTWIIPPQTLRVASDAETKVVRLLSGLEESSEDRKSVV